MFYVTFKTVLLSYLLFNVSFTQKFNLKKYLKYRYVGRSANRVRLPIFPLIKPDGSIPSNYLAHNPYRGIFLFYTYKLRMRLLLLFFYSSCFMW